MPLPLIAHLFDTLDEPRQFRVVCPRLGHSPAHWLILLKLREGEQLAVAGWPLAQLIFLLGVLWMAWYTERKQSGLV
jgi:hypothetical protein